MSPYDRTGSQSVTRRGPATSKLRTLMSPNQWNYSCFSYSSEARLGGWGRITRGLVTTWLWSNRLLMHTNGDTVSRN